MFAQSLIPSEHMKYAGLGCFEPDAVIKWEVSVI